MIPAAAGWGHLEVSSLPGPVPSSDGMETGLSWDCPLLWFPLEPGLPPDEGVCVPRGGIPRGSTWRATVVKNQTEAVRPLVTPPRGSCRVTAVASVRVPTKQLGSGGDTDPCPQREGCQRFFSHLNKQTFIEPVFYGGFHVSA